MSLVTWAKSYAGGWKNLPLMSTDFTAAVGDNYDTGLAALVDAVNNDLMRAVWVTPEQFASGTDAGDLQAALSHGASSTDHTVIVLRQGKTYDLSTVTCAWDSATGSITVLAYGATIQSEATGSAITALTHTGGNTPPRMKWLGGTYNSSTCAKFFDCTDVRSSVWDQCTFVVTSGIGVAFLNVASFCERNEVTNFRDLGSRTVARLERGFKTSSVAATFTTGTNQVTQTGHGFQSGDWCRFATVGTSGLTANQTYYVAIVVDADHYTINSAPCDAFGNFDPATAITFGTTSSGTSYDLPAGSFARTKINGHITGGTYGYGKVQIANAGPYDSLIGPFSGNIPNGVGCVDFLNGRTNGNSKFGPCLVEASDDGKTITGLASTNVVTISAAPVSRPLAVGQAVQLTKVVGGTGVVSEQTYFIKTLPTATTFTLSATPGGSTLALGTDITSGFFWNTRPWKYRWGQSAGQPPILDEPPTLRNLALYDPATFNSATTTPSVPDGTTKVWQEAQLPGVLAVNSKQYSGIDLLGASAPLTNPLNPTLYVDDGTRDQLGGLVIRPAQGKGIFLLDKTGTVLLGSDHLGVLSGSALSSVPGSLLTEAVIDFTSTKTDATTTSTTGSDITADGITAAWTSVVASSLDCTFVAPASGIVRVEIEALLKISATGSSIRFQISDVTGTPALVTNSPMSIFQAATTTNMRARYSRKFSGLTPGQTYTWRPQWLVSGAVTATLSVGAQNGPVRMSVFAWK